MLIQITDTGTSVFDDPSQGPYDGVEDTLIGVVNSSGKPVSSLALSSDTDLFGFDGDGLCQVVPQPTGCPFGPTGYEGPKTTFSNITPDLSGGVVNFTGGLAVGEATYFSLEERLPATSITVGGPTVAEQGGPPNPSQHSTTCSTGRPVNCATGEFWHQFDDLKVPGRGVALEFSRTYSSAVSSIDGPLGFGWTDSYNMSLTTDAAGNVTISQENGSTVTFRPNGAGGYTAPPRVLATLAENPDSTYTFTRRPNQLQYIFSTAGQLVSELDRNGYATKLTYNGAQLATVTDPAGRQLSFSYSGSHVSKVTDPDGRAVSFGYDADGNLTGVTDVAGGKWTFTYDASHVLLTMTDPRGGATTNTFDAGGRVAEQIDPAGRKTTWTYAGDPSSPSGGTTTMTDPKGNITTYNYSNLELISVTRGTGTAAAATTTYAYDPATLGITAVTDPKGNVTTNTYDRNGNLLSTTDALGNTTSYTYNNLDEPLTKTSPLSEITSYAYDSAGNLQSVSRPLAGTGSTQSTSFGYGDSAHPGDVTALTDPNGKTWQFAYDGNGDLTASTDPLSNKTTYAYDGIGRRTSMVSARGNASGADPAKFTTAYTYNPFGDLTKLTNPLGHTTSYAYDPNHNRTKLTDPNGNITDYSYDADDELTKVTRADGTTLSYGYDANGNQTAQTDGAGDTTSYAYDPLDRLISATDPLHRATTYAYDGAGNRTSLTDPSGRTTSYGYDDANRLTAITYSDGKTPDVSYHYDADGQRTSMTDGTGTTSYGYDSLNRLTSSANGAGATVVYDYDLAGRLTSLTYPNGKTVTRAYDDAGRLSAVADWLGNTTSFNHDPDANLTSEAYPNGVQTSAAFDNADQLTSIAHRKGTTALASFNYTRNNLGQLTSTTPTGVPGGPESYDYTPLNQLGSLNTKPYSYDHADNLARLADGTTQNFDAANQLQSSTPSGGAAGSLATDRVVSKDQPTRSSKLTSPPITTTADDELILAFISADGPGSSRQRAGRVRGGGLSWSLAARANKQRGTAEVWQAHAAGRLSAVTVTARLRYHRHGSITVAAFTGAAAAVAAKATGAARSGAPTVTLTTTEDKSLVWAAGQDWDRANAPTPNSGQTLVHQFLDTSAKNTYWVQRTDAVPTAETAVKIGDTSPTTDRWELAAVEIVPAASGPSATPVNYGYDSQGNRTSITPAGGPSTTLTYDQANRLIRYGDVATYSYNGDGLRMAKTVKATTTAFAWDEGGSIPLLLADGSDFYIYGSNGQAIERISGATVTYLHQDQQGSIRLLTDSAGSAAGAYSYDPHGNVSGHGGSAIVSLQYDGQYTDAESGFQYLRARYYDPSTSQFVSRDPYTPLTEAPFSYANNDPLNISDPLGRFGALLGGIIGGVVGGVVGAVTYGFTCGNECSARGYLGSVLGGAVGGAITGACDGGTLLVTVCGAAGGAVGEYVTEKISGDPIDPVKIAAGGFFGAAGGRLGDEFIPQVGRQPYKLSNLLSPGKNTIRRWLDSAIGGGLIGAGNVFANQQLGAQPAC